MAEEAKWYVVHTYSGYENKVASNLEKTVENRQLQDLIQEIRVPTETVTEITESGKRKEVERKIFPGYVIVKMVMTDESWYAVRNIRGCTGFVGPSSKPIPLTEDEVARLGIEKREVRSAIRWATPSTSWTGPWRALSARWRSWTWRKTACGSPFPCSAGKPPSSWSWTRPNLWTDLPARKAALSRGTMCKAVSGRARFCEGHCPCGRHG